MGASSSIMTSATQQCGAACDCQSWQGFIAGRQLYGIQHALVSSMLKRSACTSLWIYDFCQSREVIMSLLTPGF